MRGWVFLSWGVRGAEALISSQVEGDLRGGREPSLPNIKNDPSVRPQTCFFRKQLIGQIKSGIDWVAH